MTSSISNQSLPTPPSAQTFEKKPPRSKGRTILIFVFLIVVMIVAWFGVQALLTNSDNSANAEGGYEYSTNAYSVTFPGEPEVGSQEVADAGVTIETARWENKQKIYITSYYPTRDETATLDDALANAIAASGATLVESESVAIEGGTAVFYQSRIEDETLWTMVVFGDEGQFFSAAHNGAAKDQSFSDSFRIL